MSTANVINKKPERTLFRRFIVGIVALVSILGIFIFFILIFGMVHGSELNPKTFEHRSFFYYRIPFSRVQVSPSTFTTRNLPVVNSFPTNGMLKGTWVASEWHVVESTTSSGQITADPKIFVDYIHEKDKDGKLFWSVWNSENPKQAKIFWPIVSQICGDRFYLLLPELFEFARTDIPTDEFESALKNKIADISVELANDFVRSDDSDSATDVLSMTIEICPQNRKAFLERAKIYRSLGDISQAKRDEEKAKDLVGINE